jgi:carboxymethylenebutenolidase
MAIITEWVRYDGHLSYRAYPERTGPVPGVIVLQEAWGVDAHIEDVTRRIAGAGYVALAPDLYSEGGSRPPALTRERMTEILAFANSQPPTIFADAATRAAAVATQPPDLAARLTETFAEMTQRLTNSDAYVPKLLAAASYLRTKDALARGQKLGVIGFCMGGGLSGRLACADPELACAVVYYGIVPGDLAAGGRCPVLGLYGAEDARVNGSIAGFAAAMAAANRRFEQHTYDATPHAFFNDSRPSYRAPAARDAFVRTLGWLHEHLG